MQYEDYQTIIAILDGRGPEAAIGREEQWRVVLGELLPPLNRYMAAVDVTRPAQHAREFTEILEKAAAAALASKTTNVGFEDIVRGVEYGVYHVARSLKSHGKDLRDGYLAAARDVITSCEHKKEPSVRMAVHELRETVENSGPAIETIVLALRVSGRLSHRSLG
jgi:hypothetical protein